jgi:hypothetical protein
MILVLALAIPRQFGPPHFDTTSLRTADEQSPLRDFLSPKSWPFTRKVPPRVFRRCALVTSRILAQPGLCCPTQHLPANKLIMSGSTAPNEANTAPARSQQPSPEGPSTVLETPAITRTHAPALGTAHTCCACCRSTHAPWLSSSAPCSCCHLQYSSRFEQSSKAACQLFLVLHFALQSQWSLSDPGLQTYTVFRMPSRYQSVCWRHSRKSCDSFSGGNPK